MYFIPNCDGARRSGRRDRTRSSSGRHKANEPRNLHGLGPPQHTRRNGSGVTYDSKRSGFVEDNTLSVSEHSTPSFVHHSKLLAGEFLRSTVALWIRVQCGSNDLHFLN